MKKLANILTLSALMMLGNTSFADSDEVLYFRFSHIPVSKGFNQPEAGSVSARVYAYNKNLVGTIIHVGETPKSGLLLGATYHDHTAIDSLLYPNPYGKYTIDISCHGSKSFANQETTIRKSIDVPRRRGTALRIDVACPSNDLGTLIVPQTQIILE
jgi:hypothetical protein